MGQIGRLASLRRPPLRRVIAAGVPGVAAANSPNALACPANGPVFLHRLNKIRAATRMKATTLAEQWAQRPLI